MMTLWITLLVLVYVLVGVALAGVYANKVWDRSDEIKGRILVMFILLGPVYLVREKIFRRMV